MRDENKPRLTFRFISLFACNAAGRIMPFLTKSITSKDISCAVQGLKGAYVFPCRGNGIWRSRHLASMAKRRVVSCEMGAEFVKYCGISKGTMWIVPWSSKNLGRESIGPAR